MTAPAGSVHRAASEAGRASRARSTTKPRGKLAEMLAATVGDDIAAGGWRVGSVFGTETALLERYRVSRAVFREAVRLLEYHSIAQHAPRTRRRAGRDKTPGAGQH